MDGIVRYWLLPSSIRILLCVRSLQLTGSRFSRIGLSPKHLRSALMDSRVHRVRLTSVAIWICNVEKVEARSVWMGRRATISGRTNGKRRREKRFGPAVDLHWHKG